uniref:Uncharacterized protein n=1 Tax=Octopus bimaculoides TaxID=37653 RepID=A0A0L8HUN8_OCTBM
MDVQTTHPPETRIALVSQDLVRINIDVASLSETRLSGDGSMKEVGYTFFLLGKDANEPCVYGVGLAIKTELVKKHNLTSTSISEGLMSIRTPLSNKTHLTLLSACTPILNSND